MEYQLPIKKLITGAAAVLAAVIIIFGSIYVISEGERGVLTRNGAFVAVKDPGLGFKVPIIDGVTDMEIRNMRIETPVHVYSSDTQQYEAAVSVNYDLNPAEVERIFKSEGVYYADRRLKPLVETILKEVAGKYSAQRTIQERDIFGAAVRDAIREEAQRYGINVTEVQITNIDFTDQFENAIETAMLAKAKVEEERNILEQKRISAETKVVDATAEANARREQAQGEADAVRFAAEAEAVRIAQIGQAEADAIKKKAEALRNNPELTAYTYSLAAQNWDGALPTQFVPGSTLPILNVAPKGGDLSPVGN
jgi:regulator of protease activity HflC (stomatin/prohibitin superfamily)